MSQKREPISMLSRDQYNLKQLTQDCNCKSKCGDLSKKEKCHIHICISL